MIWRWCIRSTTAAISLFGHLLLLIVSLAFIESDAVLAQTSTTPVIGVSPTSLSFSAVQGGANPATKYISISNTGGGTLSWSSTDSSGWMTADASGTNSGTIPVNVYSQNGVPAGTYSATVTITAAGATTKTVPITVTITSSSSTTSTTPVIGVSPTSLSFTAVAGGANPATQYISVSNSGGGTLSWSSTDNAGWMNAIASGTNTGTIPVAVFSSGYPAGTIYSGTVTITAAGYPSQTKTIPITFTVTSATSTSTSPTIGYSPTSLSFAGTVGGTNPAGKAISISNAGGGTLSWTVSDNSGWLSVSPASGTNTGTVTASANLSGLAAGTYNGTITISATGATNSPKTIPVSLTVSSTTAKSATLTWTANVETDLAGYKIYRATTSGSYGAPIATLSKTTSYSATNLSTGTTYFFVITAYDSVGNESSYSNEVSKSIY